MVKDRDLGQSDFDEWEGKFKEEEAQARGQRSDLIEELLRNGKITSQYAELLRGVSTSTLGAESATFRKIQAIIAIREALKDLGVKQRHTVYIGAGLDWRFPVALGVRDIAMLDLEYGSFPHLRQELLDNIREHSIGINQEEGSRIGFTVDVGNGYENVSMELEVTDIGRYQPQKPIDLVLEFLGPSKGGQQSRVPVLSNVAQAMRENALIFNDDYSHDVFYTPDIGLKNIPFGQFHLYQVVDHDRMVAASHEVYKAFAPSLSSLRRSVRLHKK